MKVSAVIPTFNRAYIIRDALTSVLNQTYSPAEIIVVDDGSTDETKSVVRGIADSRIKFIVHQNNKGCSAAYNTGMEAASGDLIAFLDSDDVWKSAYLARQVDLMNRHLEVDGVFTDTEVHGDGVQIDSLISVMHRFPELLGERELDKEHLVDSRLLYLCLLEEVPIKPSAFAMKRALYTKYGGFNEDWPSGTDWDLFLRLSRVARFAFIDSPLVIQHRTSDATHRIFEHKDKEFLISVLSRERSQLVNDPGALEVVNRGLARLYRALGHFYLRDGDRLAAVATYGKGFLKTGDSGMLPRMFGSLLPNAILSKITGLSSSKRN